MLKPTRVNASFNCYHIPAIENEHHEVVWKPVQEDKFSTAYMEILRLCNPCNYRQVIKDEHAFSLSSALMSSVCRLYLFTAHLIKWRTVSLAVVLGPCFIAVY